MYITFGGISPCSMFIHCMMTKASNISILNSNDCKLKRYSSEKEEENSFLSTVASCGERFFNQPW